MKIALPTHQHEIDSHFGHCEYFTVYTISDEKKILTEEIVPSPVGCGCKSNIASVLADMGVKHMLAGNMGDGAVRVLGQAGIQVIRGCSGNVRAVAENFLNGTLTDSGVGCSTHSCDHHHD